MMTEAMNVERALRERIEKAKRANFAGRSTVMTRVDLLEATVDEVAWLKAERDALRESLETAWREESRAKHQMWEDRYRTEAAEAENARLRERLEEAERKLLQVQPLIASEADAAAERVARDAAERELAVVREALRKGADESDGYTVTMAYDDVRALLTERGSEEGEGNA